MSSLLLVKISRDGKEIGTYEAKEAVRLLVYGTLKETDFYWHEGMTDWAKLSMLQASEARRQLAERERKAKEEEARKAEQLGPAEAEQEARDDAEDVRLRRLKIEQGNVTFICNCCKDSFEKPRDPRRFFWKGIIHIFVGWFAGFFAFSMASVNSMRDGMLFFFAICLVSAIVILWGIILILSSGLRSPFCPHCHSTNYSRANRSDRPVFVKGLLG